MEYVFASNALKKRYGKYTALSGMTMNVPKGSIYGLIGRNGAGKTTAIRIICGLQEPSEGEYTLYGAGSGDRMISDARRRIGAVVETPALYRDMTAIENIRQQYRVIGVPDHSGAEELLKLVGLEDTGKKNGAYLKPHTRRAGEACDLLRLYRLRAHGQGDQRRGAVGTVPKVREA